MINPKLKVGAAVSILVVLAALLAVQQVKINHLTFENATLRSELAQISTLQDSNESLAQQLKAANGASQSNKNELLRFRGQAPRLRQLEQENAQLKSEHQQLALQVRQSQAALAGLGEGRVTVASEVTKTTAGNSQSGTTDLGLLELQSGIAVRFDLGGGTNCTITPTILSDGNNLMEIKLGVANAEAVFSELGASRVTARPGQHCSISVGDRMIALAVTLKP
jgi:hypothetical protein